jgi:predicted metal-dependent HD superfamily phosphohydrolase
MQSAPDIDYKSLYEQKSAAYNHVQLELLQLKQQLDQLKKMIFGSRHERFVPTDINPSQLSLDIQAEQTAVCSITDAKKITYIRANTTIEQKPLVHPGRMLFSTGLLSILSIPFWVYIDKRCQRSIL